MNTYTDRQKACIDCAAALYLAKWDDVSIGNKALVARAIELLTGDDESTSPMTGFSEPDADHEFKNFHRLLCERFGYVHDEKDWKRDQVSLIEWIARRVSGEPDGGAGDALAYRHKLYLHTEDGPVAAAKPVSVDAGGMNRNTVIEECALAIQASNGECPCECAGRGCDCGNYGDAAEAASWAAGNAFAATVRKLKTNHCLCAACKDGVLHKSDCSVHNMPAYPNGPCDCGGVYGAKRAQEMCAECRILAAAKPVSVDVGETVADSGLMPRPDLESDPLWQWRCIANEAEIVVNHKGKFLMLSEEMCVRLGSALEDAEQAARASMLERGAVISASKFCAIY